MSHKIQREIFIIYLFSYTLVACWLTGGVQGTKGLFVFGDSYSDTGESNVSYPYGMTWPRVEHMGNRSSDGRNQVDYLGIQYSPWLDKKNINMIPSPIYKKIEVFF